MSAMTEEQIKSYVLLFIPANEYVSSVNTTLLDLYYTNWSTYYNDPTGSSDYLTIYNTLVSCVRYIIMQIMSQISTGTFSEKEGDVTVSGSSSDPSAGWIELLDYLLEHPEIVSTTLLPADSSNSGAIIIGGVVKSTADAINEDESLVGCGYSIGEFYKGISGSGAGLFSPTASNFKKWSF